MAQTQIYVIEGPSVALFEQHGGTATRSGTGGTTDFECREVETGHRSREIAGEPTDCGRGPFGRISNALRRTSDSAEYRIVQSRGVHNPVPQARAFLRVEEKVSAQIKRPDTDGVHKLAAGFPDDIVPLPPDYGASAGERPGFPDVEVGVISGQAGHSSVVRFRVDGHDDGSRRKP